MIVTVERAIGVALVRSVRDLTAFAADHKAWVTDIEFTPPTDTYLRAKILSNGNQRITIKGSDPHLYLGILQLDVVAPHDLGAYQAKLTAAEVAKSYPADRTFVSFNVHVRVEKAPDVADPFDEDASWVVPISIRYQAFASPTLVGVGMLDFSVAGNSQYIPLI